MRLQFLLISSRIREQSNTSHCAHLNLFLYLGTKQYRSYQILKNKNTNFQKGTSNLVDFLYLMLASHIFLLYEGSDDLFIKDMIKKCDDESTDVTSVCNI
jgi:hypothetical protein